MNRSESRPSFVQAVAAAVLAGLLAGMVYLAIGIVRHGADLWLMAPSTAFAMWALVKSIALYGLLFALAGLLLGIIVGGVTRLIGHGMGLTFPLVLGLLVAGTVFAYLAAWWQLEVLAGLPFGDAERLSGALRHGLIGLGAGAVCAIVAGFAGRLRRRRGGNVRPALAALAGCLVLLGITQVALRSGDPGVDRDDRPSQVVVAGFDALSLRIMGPMLRAGELPTFRKLVDGGAWGTFLTYGQASSPMVWTTMATGKRVRQHGINDFVIKRPGTYGVEPIKSFDRRCRAIWNILSDFGRSVGLVDWLITYPPEEVNGYVVTRLHMEEENRTSPPELNDDVKAILATTGDYGDEARTRNFSRIDHVFDTTRMLMAKQHLDFVALFEGVSDWVEHRYWKYYEPERFDQQLWQYGGAEIGQVGSMIPDTYAHLDRRLGELLNDLDDDALLMVVSDHGQLAVQGRQVWMRANRILEALGYATVSDQEGKQVDHATSRAYAAVETPWAPVIGVNLNLVGREPEGIVDPGEADALVQELVKKLRAVRFEDGKPLFGAVTVNRGGRGTHAADQADIVIDHSRYTRSDRYSQRPIMIGERRYRLDDFMEADTKISGGHDHQGLIFLYGKGVRPGPIGQEVVSTALQEMIWHLTDKIAAVDRLLPLLGRLGLIERATTLDVTPTILHAFGLPVAEDMAGRALADIVETGGRVDRVATYESDEAGGTRAVDAESDDDLMRRLKALGYIN